MAEETAHKQQFLLMGEPLIELRHTNASHLALNFYSDIIATAKYLHHYADELDIEVMLLSAVGTDPYSKLLMKIWQDDNINTDYVATIDDKTPGLFLRLTTKSGATKRFFYRKGSAVEHCFANEKVLENLNTLAKVNFIFLSTPMLALLDKIQAETLLNLLNKANDNGATIIYSSHNLAKVWQDKQLGEETIQRLLVHTDIALCFFKQEQAFFHDDSPSKTVKRLHSWGIREVMLIVDEKTCIVSSKKHGKQEIDLDSDDHYVSDVGVLDAFYAGYIIARIKKATPEKAVAFGQQFANIARKTKSALIPSDKLPSMGDTKDD